MWEESDPIEREKLIKALEAATLPIREAIKHFKWEGEFLTCGPELLSTSNNRKHWRNLYFYLSGYGDKLFQTSNAAIKKEPVSIPVAPSKSKP